MPGAGKIKVARYDYDSLQADNVDLSFTTDLYLQKFFRNIRSTSEQSIAHGLSYPPKAFFMRELSSDPLQIGHYSWAEQYPLADSPSIDDTNINFKIATHTPYYTGEYAEPVADAATIAILTIDPLVEPAQWSEHDFGYPVIKVGSDNGDYAKRLHSGYDSLKVFTTGTLTLELDVWSTDGSDSDVQSVTFEHNLGYVPFFSPFIPAQISLNSYYGWLYQWHNYPGGWTVDTEYIPKDNLQEPLETGAFYGCFKRHTSAADNKPGSGANWETYWEEVDGSYKPPDLDLNELEDVKIVYGGVEDMAIEEMRFYATTTELVLEIERYGFGDFPARTITVDYTIFYNRVDEEYNILDL